uniref:NIDO domain-containing protein n=1 Tax=Amphimedon queenslandica TaxID=400682 RepID=A0A1X7TXA4_AMPQE
MGSGLLIGFILVILSACYTNGLTLSDLYPYGTELGDTISSESSITYKPLQPSIDNLVRLGSVGLTATRYHVGIRGFLTFENDNGDSISMNLLFKSSGDFSNTKAYGRTTADPGLINRAMDQINEGFPNTFCSTSPPTQLIIGTWIDYLKTGSNQGSNFQLIVATNGNITFGIALYVNVRIASADAGIDSLINSNYVPVDPSFFPFGTTIMNAPSMMLNSNIPGTYIFSLNHVSPGAHASYQYLNTLALGLD